MPGRENRNPRQWPGRRQPPLPRVVYQGEMLLKGQLPKIGISSFNRRSRHLVEHGDSKPAHRPFHHSASLLSEEVQPIEMRAVTPLGCDTARSLQPLDFHHLLCPSKRTLKKTFEEKGVALDGEDGSANPALLSNRTSDLVIIHLRVYFLG